MTLVDSSAWIEYYRPTGDSRVQEEVAALIAADRASVNGIIEVEVVAFAPSENERAQLTSDFRAFHRLELTDTHFELACRIGFDLRRRGVTVPATDLIIAASAIRAGEELVHLDGHFVRIAEVSDLVERDLR